MTAAKFYTWHEQCTIMAGTKACWSDDDPELNYSEITFVSETSLVKWAPALGEFQHMVQRQTLLVFWWNELTNNM